MKVLALHLLPALLVLTIAASAQNNNSPSPIAGTWQLVSGSYKKGNNASSRDSSTVIQYKVITNDWFMFTAFSKGADTLLAATMGHLTYNGKEMTHTAVYSTSRARVGVTATYAVEVNGAILRMKGKLMGGDLEEVWIRKQ